MPAVDVAPAKMLGHRSRLDAADEARKARQVSGVESVRRSERQPNAVQGHRVIAADRIQCRDGRARRRRNSSRCELRASRSRDARRGRATRAAVAGRCPRRREVRSQQSRAREEKRCAGLGMPARDGQALDQEFGGVILPPIFSQVPLATYFQEMGSLSTVLCPAHACLPAAQSFCPALATPKHLSLLASAVRSPRNGSRKAEREQARHRRLNRGLVAS